MQEITKLHQPGEAWMGFINWMFTDKHVYFILLYGVNLLQLLDYLA